MIALASKNAILIVEFARDLHREGLSITEAAVEATRRRFRPIVMTSFAFILGVVPLMVASGAGAASQQAIGTVVFGGMMASTLLAIPFVPVFYVLAGAHERATEEGPGSATANTTWGGPPSSSGGRRIGIEYVIIKIASVGLRAPRPMPAPASRAR